MNGFYKAVVEKLKERNYRFSGPGKGSHEIWTNGKRNQVVPFNCKSRHTANEIMKQAGIKHKFD